MWPNVDVPLKALRPEPWLTLLTSLPECLSERGCLGTYYLDNAETCFVPFWVLDSLLRFLLFPRPKTLRNRQPGLNILQSFASQRKSVYSFWSNSIITQNIDDTSRFVSAPFFVCMKNPLCTLLLQGCFLSSNYLYLPELVPIFCALTYSLFAQVHITVEISFCTSIFGYEVSSKKQKTKQPQKLRT